jgi:hypothetical protein
LLLPALETIEALSEGRPARRSTLTLSKLLLLEDEILQHVLRVLIGWQLDAERLPHREVRISERPLEASHRCQAGLAVAIEVRADRLIVEVSRSRNLRDRHIGLPNQHGQHLVERRCLVAPFRCAHVLDATPPGLAGVMTRYSSCSCVGVVRRFSAFSS